MHVSIKGNLNLESRQDSNHYDSKQTQAGAGFSVAIYGSGSSASANYSQNKAKVNYAQVEEQTGFHVGKGGMDVKVAGNTHLAGSVIDSEAAQDKNHFKTKSLTHTDIENRSEVEVKSVSAGLSTDMAQNAKNAMAAVASALGNKHESATSQTQSAIGSNIQIDTETPENLTALYGEIYKLQYQKRLLETVVGIAAGSPDVAITQGTLQLAATKMREETLANSRLFKGIKDAKTGKILRNDSYDSGYFDGVKLGGVRIDVDAICNSNMGTCTYNDDNSITFKGNKDYTLDDAIDPQQNKKAGGLYGETGGFQSVQGEWNLHFTRIPYRIGSISDMAVESFAGTHDLLGGQVWGWYDKQGNTAEKNKLTGIASGVTTVIAIPVSAPFALSDVMSSDMFELLMKIGGK